MYLQTCLQNITACIIFSKSFNAHRTPNLAHLKKERLGTQSDGSVLWISVFFGTCI